MNLSLVTIITHICIVILLAWFAALFVYARESGCKGSILWSSLLMNAYITPGVVLSHIFLRATEEAKQSFVLFFPLVWIWTFFRVGYITLITLPLIMSEAAFAISETFCEVSHFKRATSYSIAIIHKVSARCNSLLPVP